MSQATTAACKLNDRHYFYEKNSISQYKKKCLAFRGSLQNIFLLDKFLLVAIRLELGKFALTWYIKKNY